MQDYRAVEGEYDAVVSVDMIKVVGYEYWPIYVQTIDRVLAPGGKVAIQAITMPHGRMLATRNACIGSSASGRSPHWTAW